MPIRKGLTERKKKTNSNKLDCAGQDTSQRSKCRVRLVHLPLSAQRVILQKQEELLLLLPSDPYDSYRHLQALFNPNSCGKEGCVPIIPPTS